MTLMFSSQISIITFIIFQDDLILMPDDVEFKAVPACTTGRVFVLKFKGNDKKMFFWMQVGEIFMYYLIE